MANNFNDVVLLVDMDDTIENLVDAWCDWLNRKYNFSVSPETITDWDIAQFYPGLTKQQVFEPLNLEDFWHTVKPKEDAIVYLKKLQDEGFQIYICTSTHYKNVLSKYECVLQKYFPFIDWKHVIIAHDKQMISADCLIDDAPHNLEGGQFQKILFTAYHNKMYDEKSGGMIRVNNWEETYNVIHFMFG